MRLRLSLPLSVAGAGLLAVSCTTPVCGCLSPPPYAILHGRISTPDGAGVGGARVSAESGDPSCASPRPAGEGVSRPDGGYTLTVHGLGLVRPGDCLRAYARAPQSAAPAVSDTVRFAVRFASEAPIDSARVDLVLRTP